MRVGIVGTGAIAHKHALAYKEIGYELVAVSNRGAEKGSAFADKYGATFIKDYRNLCKQHNIDYVDICSFPDSRLAITREAVAAGKHVLVQKPIALTLSDAAEMIRLTREAGLRLGVVSQYRFDESSLFVKGALDAGRLGTIIQADGYVKWHRPQTYYDRPGKGTWAIEGGGALINQGIHTADLLLYFAGAVREVQANWQLGATHKMESEDVVNALLTYSSGSTGVLQASTSMQPGYPEKVELHGTKGSAVIEGGKLVTFDLTEGDNSDAPISHRFDSGASDPMAISIEPIKRQFVDFGEAVAQGRDPKCAGKEGYEALALVMAIYDAARQGRSITPGQGNPL